MPLFYHPVGKTFLHTASGVIAFVNVDSHGATPHTGVPPVAGALMSSSIESALKRLVAAGKAFRFYQN
jgi:hypothetical protein